MNEPKRYNFAPKREDEREKVIRATWAKVTRIGLPRCGEFALWPLNGPDVFRAWPVLLNLPEIVAEWRLDERAECPVEFTAERSARGRRGFDIFSEWHGVRVRVDRVN